MLHVCLQFASLSFLIVFDSLLSPQLAFKWFDHCITDLEMDTQHALFQKQVLRVDPAIIDLSGYHCIKTFFETINLSERKLRKMHSGQLVSVERLREASYTATRLSSKNSLIYSSNIRQQVY